MIPMYSFFSDSEPVETHTNDSTRTNQRNTDVLIPFKRLFGEKKNSYYQISSMKISRGRERMKTDIEG